MAVNFSPSVLIFINNDLTQSIQDTFTQQFYLSEPPMLASEFDLRVANDPNYPHIIHLQNLRIMVMRNLQDQTNRALADIVMFYKSGLVSIEWNRYGPPGITLQLERAYLSALINLDRFTECCCKCRKNLFNQFVGEPSGCFNFEEFLWGPNGVYPRRVPEPVDPDEF